MRSSEFPPLVHILSSSIHSLSSALPILTHFRTVSSGNFRLMFRSEEDIVYGFVKRSHNEGYKRLNELAQNYGVSFPQSHGRFDFRQISNGSFKHFSTFCEALAPGLLPNVAFVE